jgi:hypothetical protein
MVAAPLVTFATLCLLRALLLVDTSWRLMFAPLFLFTGASTVTFVVMMVLELRDA